MAKRIQRLFNHNPPPRGDELLEELFINREAELRDGFEFLTVGQDFDPQIYAIHGDSRTGKSHLARLLLDRLDAHFTIVEINANSMGTARMALENLYASLLNRLEQIDVTEPDPDGLQAEDVLHAFRPYFRALLPLVEGHADQVQVKTVEAVHDRFTARVGTRATYFEERHEARWSREREVTVTRPGDTVLVTYLRGLCDVLYYAHGKRPVLVYIDDLDLLTRRGDSEGDLEAERLMTLLTPLAESERLVVVASVRSLYYGKRDKALKGYLEICRLEDDQLRAIYNRQIGALHEDEPVFTEPCVQRLLSLAEGRVGVFLSFCYRLWRHAKREVPITEGTFEAFIEKELRDLMRKPSTAAMMGQIIEWIHSGVTAGELPDVDCEDGPLAFLIVRPSAYGTAGRVELIPETTKVLRRITAGAPS